MVKLITFMKVGQPGKELIEELIKELMKELIKKLISKSFIKELYEGAC